VGTGEWTDDTQQTVALAECTATGTLDLDAVATALLAWWASGPPDVGISTAAILRAAARAVGPAGRTSGPDAGSKPAGPAAILTRAAADHLATHPKGGAGNGALMRTAPVALAHLGDDTAMAAAARSVATLTHADPLAGDSCVLWCIAIDRAVREGRLDGVREGLSFVAADRRPAWEAWIGEAEALDPATFRPNGFTVRALQAAHAAIHQTPVPSGRTPRATSRMRCTRRCASVMTPTRSRPSPGRCSGPDGVLRRSPTTGVTCCTPAASSARPVWSSPAKRTVTRLPTRHGPDVVSGRARRRRALPRCLGGRSRARSAVTNPVTPSRGRRIRSPFGGQPGDRRRLGVVEEAAVEQPRPQVGPLPRLQVAHRAGCGRRARRPAPEVLDRCGGSSPASAARICRWTTRSA
jgi:hypothetical protein